jgi:hypothetical protein
MSEEISLPNLVSETEYQKMSPHAKETYIKGALRQILNNNPHGVTVTQLHQALRHDRRIIEKHLELMQFTNEVYTVKLGSNVLYVPNHKAMHEATSHFEKFGDNEYQVYTLNNRLGDFAVIQQRRPNRDTKEITGSLQIPLKDYVGFVNYLRRTITDMERRGSR